jgi:D-ribose pyranase
MYKGKCINPQLSTVLALTGHTDMLCVTDAGFPIPRTTERIDLAWEKGKPGWLEVCKLIKEELVLEKIYLAEDIKIKSPDMYDSFKTIFYDVPIEFILHSDLKQMSKEARAVIRTGEYTSFCNCIFVAGVAF